MKINIKIILLMLLLILSTVNLLSGCNSIEGSDKRIPNVGKMEDPDETDLKF